MNCKVLNKYVHENRVIIKSAVRTDESMLPSCVQRYGYTFGIKLFRTEVL